MTAGLCSRWADLPLDDPGRDGLSAKHLQLHLECDDFESPNMIRGVAAVPQRYRRAPRMVFRALDGRAWVGGPGRDTVGIEGSALFVWLVLDRPASVGGLAQQIRTVWPELGEIAEPDVQAAIDSLVGAELVETMPAAASSGDAA